MTPKENFSTGIRNRALDLELAFEIERNQQLAWVKQTLRGLFKNLLELKICPRLKETHYPYRAEEAAREKMVNLIIVSITPDKTGIQEAIILKRNGLMYKGQYAPAVGVYTSGGKEDFGKLTDDEYLKYVPLAFQTIAEIIDHTNEENKNA